MAAVAGSVTALTAIFQSSIAMAAVNGSQIAINAIANTSGPVITQTVVNLAGLPQGTYTSMAQIAASQTAMAAVAASPVAMAAVAASSVAVAALKASPLCKVYNPANENAWRTDTFTGSGILIRISNYNTSSAYYKIDNGADTAINAQQLDVVKAYKAKLVAYWVDFSGPSDRGIYRIVLTGN